MRIRLELFVDTNRDRVETAEEIKDILRKTSDYQHGDLTVTSSKTIFEDCIDIQTYLKDCSDMGHTRQVLNSLWNYICHNFA